MLLGLTILFLIFFVPILFIYSECFIGSKYLKNPEEVNFINKYIYLFVAQHSFLILFFIGCEFLILYIFSQISLK